MSYKTYIYYGARESKDDCSGLNSHTRFAKAPLKKSSFYYNIKNGLYLDSEDIPITGIGDNTFYYNGKDSMIDDASEKQISDYLKKIVFK